MDNLQLFWQCFVACECDSEKKIWLELFIYEYQKSDLVKDGVCLVENRFLSSVASHLTSYMLKLIYTTICASISSTNQQIIKNTNKLPNNNVIINNMKNDADNCQNNNEPRPQVIVDYEQYLRVDQHGHLEKPGDLMRIVALRKFFLENLGGKILRVLRSVGGMNINGSRELCNVLINIFPTAPWTQTPVNSKSSSTILKFNDFIQIYSLKHNQKGRKIEQAPTNSTILEEFSFFYGLSEALTPLPSPDEYITDEFLAATNLQVPFNEYGWLVLDLLYDLIANESIANIDSNSMTMHCLRFGVDNLKGEKAGFVFQQAGEADQIKSKLLAIIMKSLSNLTVAGKLGCEFVAVDKVFSDLFDILSEAVSVSETNANNAVFLKVIYYCLLCILDNLTEYNDRQTVILEIFKTRSPDVLVQLARVFKQATGSDEHLKCLLEQIIKITKCLKLEDHVKLSEKKKRRKKKPASVKCNHHVVSHPNVCALETLLLQTLATLSPPLQVYILKAMQQLASCCCCVTVENIGSLLSVYIGSASDLAASSSIYLNFIKNELLLKVYAQVSCDLCETKRQSSVFQKELLICYQNTAFDPQADDTKLYVLLEHLQKMVKVFTYETLLQLLADCILPIFRKHKENYQNSQANGCERLVQCCLRLFTTCLRDLRLVKAFYNTENVEHLQDLSMREEFAQNVCQLLRVGLQNQHFLGESPEEQRSLSQQLRKIVYQNTITLTNAVIKLHQDFNHHFEHIQLKVIDPIDRSLFSDTTETTTDDSIKQILMKNIVYWNTIFQLTRINEQFKVDFQHYLYSYYKDSEILFILVYNSLKCYLCSNQEALRADLDDEDTDDFFIVNLNGSGDIATSMLELNTNRETNYFNVNKNSDDKKQSVLDIDYSINYAELIKNFDTIELLFETKSSDNAGPGECFRKLNYSDVFGQLWGLQSDTQAVVKPIFHLKQSKSHLVLRQNGVGEILFCENFDLIDFLPKHIETNSQKSFDHIAFYINSTYFMKKFLNTLSSPQKSVEKVNDFLAKSILGGLFVTPNNVNDAQRPADKNYDPYFTKEQLNATTGDESLLKYLLLLFEIFASNFMMMTPTAKSSSSICSSTVSESDVTINNMDTALEQLRNLITSQSIKYWHSLENGIAILNALQSLLKIAESRNSCCTSKYCSLSNSDHCHSVDDNTDTDDLRKDMKIVDVYSSVQPQSCEYLMKNLQSDNEHYESDIETSDDNETIEESYQTADEGYDADAEFMTFNEQTETDDNDIMTSTFCPASHFRSKIVYDNLCKIVVEILFDLSKKCLKDATFWPALLTQLATRLITVRESLGGSKFLLSGFQPVLESDDVWLQDFQKTVLELVTDLNTPESCSAYLSLFASHDPPVELLLTRLTSLWNSSIKLQPSIEIEFPSVYTPTISASCDPIVLQNIKSIHDYHEHFKIRSAITETCNIIPMNQLNFKPWNTDGFTVTTWLSVKDTPTVDINSTASAHNMNEGNKQFLNHLLSVGTEKLLFSVYISNTREIYLKLIKPNADLSEKRSPLDQVTSSASSSESPNDLKRQAAANEFLHKKGPKRKVLRNIVPPACDVKLVGVHELAADLDNVSTSSNKENLDSTIVNKFRKHQPNEGLNLFSDPRGALHSTKAIFRNSLNKITLFSPTKLQPTDYDAGVDLLRWPVKVKNMKLPKNKWNQLCFAVEPSGKFIMVTITLDGAEQQSIEISCPITAYASKTSKLSLLCVGANDRVFGDTTDGSDPKDTGNQQLNYSMANVMVFKQSLPNQVILSNLYAYGPECSSLIKCQLDNPLPNLGLLNFKKLTIADDFRTGEAVRSLAENLIGIYSSHKPNIMTGNRYGDHEGLPIGLVTFGNLPEKHFIPSYYTAIYLSGGLQTILFLFARIVELTDSSHTQSSALHLLLKIAHSNAEFYTEFVRKNYMSLIFLVIKHQKCAKNLDMLKSILDVALDAPILTKRSDTEPYQVIPNSTACIVYPELLLYTLKNYSSWSDVRQCDSDVLDLVLGALLVLVREKHPQQELNSVRLVNAGIITILLNFCKIHLVLVTNPIYISKSAAESLVTLIATLAGAPPSPSLLDEIIKLLILMHRPSDSYITHDRSKFYFILATSEPNKQKQTPKRSNLSLKMRDRKSTISTPPLIRLNATTVAASEGNLYTKSSFSVSSSKEAGEDLEKTLTTSTDSSPSQRFETDRLMQDWETKLNRILIQQQKNNSSSSSDRVDEQKRLKNKYNLNLLNDNEAEQLNEALGNLHIKRQLNLKPLTRKNHRRTISRSYRKRSESEKDEMSGSVSESGIEEDFNRKSGCRINLSSGKDSDDRISSPETSDDKLSMYLSSGSIYIQEGLFNLLRDFILILPDSSAQEVLKHYVTMEILLVISSHNNEKVRAAILRLFDVIVNRLPTPVLNQYSKNNFWLHLGNQISLYPADFHLVQSCMQWITGTNILMELQSDYQELPPLNVEQKYGFNVLMSVLPGILQNKQLSVVTLEFLRRVYEDFPESAQYMIENGLLSSAIKTVTKLYGKFQNPDEQIVESICKLLSYVAHRAFISVGAINVLWDLLNGLTYVEQGKSGNVKRGCRIIQSVILYNLLQSCINNNVDVKTSTSIFGLKSTKGTTIQILGCQLSTAEMKTRFDFIFDRTVQFLTNVTNQYQQTQVEIRLIESVLQLVISGHSKGGSILIWALCPARPLVVKVFCIRMLDQYTKTSSSNLSGIDCDVKLLKILAQSMLLMSRDSMEDDDVVILTEFCNSLGGPQNSSWNLAQALERIDVMREISLKEHKPAIERSVFKNEFIIQACMDTAMSITRGFVEVQNAERRTLMNFMRNDNDNYAINEWNNIVSRLTHEGAPWFNRSSSKNAWQLDETEGPDRVRIRLKPCHLKIEQRFLLNENTDAANGDQTILSYLTSMKRNENLALSDQVLYTFNVKHVTVEKECEGEIIITEIEFLFIESNDYTPGASEPKEWINCDIASISEIWPRRHQHNDNSLEVFFESKQSLFFVFKNLVDRDMMLKYFSDKVVQSPDTPKLTLATQQWREGQLSNWEYLSMLNQMSGRTYHDLMQYPIFPWILSDYDSCILNLLDVKNFRKLDRPIAVQHKELESHYINNYNYLVQSIADGGGGNTIQMGPYHYGSHYSNSGTVLHFLVRILPFTTLFLHYQDNNFDIPDRTFHSLQTTWRLASKDSPTDVKELIPEFFCLPEMLENCEGFNFGHRQSGEAVHHIALPAWCQNSSRLFTFIHRQALESDIVRSSLNSWIDLIFGYKQTGQAALDAINVFHPATYHDFPFDIANIDDVVEQMAFETMVRTYGQMPKKLFRAPHPNSKWLQPPIQESGEGASPAAPPPPVMSTVIGLKWGQYTGSPQLKAPTMIDFFEQFEISFSCLVALEATNVVYGVPDKCNIMRGYEVDTLNIVAWGELDDIVRIKSLSDDCEYAPRHLIHVPKIDPITACGTNPNSTQLWLGHASGRITVYKCYSLQVPKHYKNHLYENTNKLSSYNSAFRKIGKSGATKSSGEFEHLNNSVNYGSLNNMRWTAPVVLIKHTDEITGIQLSTSFKVVVSIGRDGVIAIWDMNKLEYIRSIEPSSFTNRFPLTHVTISQTLGDIVSVYSLETVASTPQNSTTLAEVATESFDVTEPSIGDDFVKVSMNLEGKSQLRLHTINARYINHLTLQTKIEAVCYSGIKEGSGVNVIAVAFENGHINLYSSWNLNFVREIDIGNSDIQSILYSTYQYLVILTKDNIIQVWESAGLQGSQPKFPQIVFSKRRSV